MSDSVRSHRQQPTRLPRPWDSPGKNTGVGCHFLLQCMKVKSESEVPQSCLTLCDPFMDCSLPGFSIHEIFQARVLAWVAISFPNLRYEYYLKINVHLNELWRFLYHYLKTKFFFFYHFLWKLLHKSWNFEQYMIKWHSISMCSYHHYPYPELFNHHKQKLCT